MADGGRTRNGKGATITSVAAYNDISINSKITNSLSTKDLRERAKRTLRGVEMRNPQFPYPVTISNNGIKEWINQPFKDYTAKNKAILRLPKIFSEADYLGYGPDKHDGRREMHLFGTKIRNTESWIIVRNENHSYQIHSISDSPKIAKFITRKKT